MSRICRKAAWTVICFRPTLNESPPAPAISVWTVVCVPVLHMFLLCSFLSKATGMDAPDTGRLSHIYQLSGFADPVYAEACVTVHDYDIVLEVCFFLCVAEHRPR